MKGDQGAALIVALLAMVLLTGLGVGAILLADTERLVSANYERSIETLYAADAMTSRAMSDLRMTASWTGVVAGAVRSPFADSTTKPRVPSGVTVDLDAITAEIQAQSDAIGPSGADRPVWRLFAWGPVSGLLALATIDSGQYGAVWIADDRFDADGNAAADGNGVVAMHAEAFGWAGARRIIEAVVGRILPACEPPGPYGLASLRPIRTTRVFRSRFPGLADLQICTHDDGPAVLRLLSWREVR